MVNVDFLNAEHARALDDDVELPMAECWAFSAGYEAGERDAKATLTAQPMAQEPISGYCGCEPRNTTHSLVTGRITCNHCVADLGSIATPAPVEAGLRAAAITSVQKAFIYARDARPKGYEAAIQAIEALLEEALPVLRAQSSPVGGLPVTEAHR